MNTLLVKQSLSNGATKTWKLRSTEKVFTFGASRVADVISISPTTKGMEGTFEFRDGNWWYIDMNSEHVASGRPCQVCLDKEQSIEIAGSTLHFTPIAKEADLYIRLENAAHNKDGVRKPYQLFLVKYNGQVIETKVLPMGEGFVPTGAVNKKLIPAKDTDTWVQYKVDELLVRQKTVYLTDSEAMSRITASQFVDKEDRKGVLLLLLAALFVVGLGALGPKKEEVVVLPKEVPAQKIIVKTDLKKKKKVAEKPVEQPKQQAAAPAAAPKAKPDDKPAPGGKVANMLKAVSDPRISRLIGKVSAQAAKSGNVIISNGIKAGSGTPSGRALAAVGNVDRSGRDYGTDAGAKGVAIGTAGRGGGQNTSGLGGLGAGNTGNAGVGLIEEESEIVGGLDREVIAQYIKTQLGQILYCYERQLSANPELFGKVAVKFTIIGSGHVEHQTIGDTTLKNATVEGCILNKVARWKFPAPAGGTKVLVTYPFLFKSNN